VAGKADWLVKPGQANGAGSYLPEAGLQLT
jgi:hypothetical protein